MEPVICCVARSGYSGGILLIAAIATNPPLLWQIPIRPSEHHESFLAL